MIKDHNTGLETHHKYKNQFPIEIECLCLNSAHLSKEVVEAKLKAYKNIALELESCANLKESEFHEEDKPYYELSIYCDFKDINMCLATLKEYGIEIDIIHFGEAEFTEQEFTYQYLTI